MNGRLQGRAALVTGAGSGIGRGVAVRFAAEGARVALLDLDADGLSATAAAITDAGGTALALPADVTHEAAVAAAVAHATESFGGLDVAVVNAGVQLFGQDARVSDLDLEVWQRTIGVNLTGAFLTAKHAVRALLAAQEADPRPAGRSLIFTGSPTGLFGGARGFSAYSASKAGVHGLMRVIAADYAEHGLRVNAVVPGYTATPLVRSLHEDEAAESALLSGVPLGRPGTVEEVAAMNVFLASDESSYCTGAFFTGDGGLTAI